MRDAPKECWRTQTNACSRAIRPLLTPLCVVLLCLASRRPSLSPVAFKTVVPSPVPSTPGLTPTSTHTVQSHPP
jgi:hypothetical protein